MPEIPSPYYDASERVVALARELEDDCPKAAVTLLVLASTMKIADFDSRAIDGLTMSALAIGDVLQTMRAEFRQQVHKIAESN